MTSTTAAAPAEEILSDQAVDEQRPAEGLEQTAGRAVAPPVPEEETASDTATGDQGADTGPSAQEREADEVAERLGHRRALLDPVASKLLELLDQHRELDSPSQINLGGSSVHVSRWERDLVLEHHGNGEFSDRGWVTRVMDAISFQARALIDRDRLDRAPSEATRSLNQLVMTSAVGIALKTELQKTVDRLIFSGEVATAKQLTQTLQRVGQALAECREALEPSQSWPAAVELAPGLTCIPEDATLPEAPARKRRRRTRQPSADEEAALAELETRARESTSPRRDRTSRVRVMLVTLLVLAAAWTGIVLFPMLTRDPLPTLTISDFRTVPQVRQVTARPPSLYVVVSERDWNRLSPDSRVKVVDQIGEIARRAEYAGALVRTSGDVTVARWFRKSGSTLVEE